MRRLEIFAPGGKNCVPVKVEDLLSEYLGMPWKPLYSNRLSRLSTQPHTLKCMLGHKTAYLYTVGDSSRITRMTARGCQLSRALNRV